MSTINVSNINDGDAVTASSINNQVNTIVNDYNGNITAANLAANAVTDAKITANNLLASKFSNPYKFSVYRNAAQNLTAAPGFTLIQFDTKLFDTGSNIDVVTNKGRFTAPIAGFYQFNSRLGTTGPGQLIATLYKNGSALQRGTHLKFPADAVASTYSGLVQAAANDYFEMYYYADSNVAIDTIAQSAWFSGFLVSSI